MLITPSSKSFGEEFPREQAFLVHLTDEGRDFAAGEVQHAFAKEPLILGKGGQGRDRSGGDGVAHRDRPWGAAFTISSSDT